MPYLGITTSRLTDRLGSPATNGEGRQNLLCAYLAAALLVHLLANAAFGARRPDPAIGLLIAGVAVKESAHAWRRGTAPDGGPMRPARMADRDVDAVDLRAAPANRTTWWSRQLNR